LTSNSANFPPPERKSPAHCRNFVPMQSHSHVKRRMATRTAR